MLELLFKAAQTSKGYMQAYENVRRWADRTRSAKSVLLSCILKSHGLIDRGVAEWCHFINSNRTAETKYRYPDGSIGKLRMVRVSLIGGKRIKMSRTQDVDGERKPTDVVTMDNIMDAYARRKSQKKWVTLYPEIVNCNLQKFATEYGFFAEANALHLLTAKVFASFYPRGSSDYRKLEPFQQYCRYQLLKFCPWDTTPPREWDATSFSIVQTYHDFLISKQATSLSVRSTELVLVQRALNRARQKNIDLSDNTDSAEEEFDQARTWEAGKLKPYQIVSRREKDRVEQCLPGENTKQDYGARNKDVDWGAAHTRWGGEGAFAGVQNWIEATKRQEMNNMLKKRKQMRKRIDIRGLNFHQANAVSTIVQMYQEGKGGVALLYGTAGTGKSHVIKTLVQLFGDEVLLSAPTACAAQVIGGGTWQGNFPLPVKHLRRKKLTLAQIAVWQEKLKGKKILVLDEVSMADSDLMGWWECILRQIFNPNQRFGGMIILLAGDHGQLPPICALPLYSDVKARGNTETKKCFSGYMEYIQIRKVCFLEKVERVDAGEQKLTDMLTAVRDGLVEDSDTDPTFQTLSSRFPMNLSAMDRAQFEDEKVVHLWYCKKPVQEYNAKKLQELDTPVARICAAHPDKASALASPDDAGGLVAELEICVGARVMYGYNAWQSAFLNNGSLGKVYDIIYTPGSSPPELPLCVLVQFDKYIGPSFLKEQNVPRIVPIVPLTRTWESPETIGTSQYRALSRTQIPLSLAYAMTIYKAQGQEFEQLMVHPGLREWQAGALFVALSRAKRLSGLCVEKCTVERLLKIAEGKQIIFRMLEEVRLRDLARRHLVDNFKNLQQFCVREGIVIPEAMAQKVEQYRDENNYMDKLYLAEKTAVHYRFKQAKDKKRAAKKNKCRGQRKQSDRRTVPTKRKLFSQPACRIGSQPATPDPKLSGVTPSPITPSAVATRAGRDLRSEVVRRRSTRLRQRAVQKKARRETMTPEHPPLNLVPYLQLSPKQQCLVDFFRRQLVSRTYTFRLTPNTQNTRMIRMHGCDFVVDDLADFATHGRFCTCELVKVSAMCAYEALEHSSYPGPLKKLMVLRDNQAQLLLLGRDLNLACDVWTHVNHAGSVLAVIWGQPRGMHWVGIFVRKIGDRTFEINPRDSLPSCGKASIKYCNEIKRMIVACAKVLPGGDLRRNDLRLQFIVQARPSWTATQARGSHACGHYQAASCISAAMDLLDTHRLDYECVQLIRQRALWQILEQDTVVRLPVRQSQRAGMPIVELLVRDVFLEMIRQGLKRVDCRPNYECMNEIGPGTTVHFKCKKDMCERIVSRVERYASFRQALQYTGLQHCLPGFHGTMDDAVDYYYKLHAGYQALERDNGVIALHLCKLVDGEKNDRSVSVGEDDIPNITSVSPKETRKIASCNAGKNEEVGVVQGEMENKRLLQCDRDSPSVSKNLKMCAPMCVCARVCMCVCVHACLQSSNDNTRETRVTAAQVRTITIIQTRYWTRRACTK